MASGAVTYARTTASLADALAYPNATAVTLSSPLIISATYASSYYAQEMDRTRGIRIDGTCPYAIGDTIRVSGKLATANGERRLINVEVEAVQL